MLQLEILDSEEYPPDVQRLRRLWLAVFYLGLQDYTNERKLGYTKGPAKDWFESAREYPGSFVWLCDLFDWCPDRIRDRVRMNLRRINRAPEI